MQGEVERGGEEVRNRERRGENGKRRARGARECQKRARDVNKHGTRERINGELRREIHVR